MARKDRHTSSWCGETDDGELGRPRGGPGGVIIRDHRDQARTVRPVFSSTLSGGDREPEGGPFRWAIAGDRLIFEGFDPGSE